MNPSKIKLGEWYRCTAGKGPWCVQAFVGSKIEVVTLSGLVRHLRADEFVGPYRVKQCKRERRDRLESLTTTIKAKWGL